MMLESGMMDEMAEMYGDDVSMGELQKSFESFFKASMGFGTGPVLMPDGSYIDAADVPKMSQMDLLDDFGEEVDLDEEEMMVMMAMMMCCTLRLFHSSQTQKPIPTPPVSISAATMTSQATPMERRTPVSMEGSVAGNRMRVNTFHSERLSTRAILR